MRIKPILLLDFDGVIHSYTSGWQGAGQAADPPVPGAAKFIRQALEHFDVRVYSSRSTQPGGLKCMRDYLEDRVGLTPSEIAQVGFPTGKDPAFLMIDDRTIRFNGSWEKLMPAEKLLSFRPWHETGTQELQNDRELTDFRMLEDGEEASFGRLREENIYWPLVCCDCGLVHIVRLELDGDVLKLRFWRDEESTAAARDHIKSFFQTPRSEQLIKRKLQELDPDIR